jgi:ribonuclease HI
VIVAVYTDAGLANSNPSTQGGAYAWVQVGSEGEVLLTQSKFLKPADLGLTSVSNNQLEFLAILNALKALPAGWRGHVYSDSDITLCRFEGGSRSFRNILPAWLVEMRSEVSRLGAIKWTLVKGHPTKAELARGLGKGGSPVSVFNKLCDEMCRAAIDAATAG